MAGLALVGLVLAAAGYALTRADPATSPGSAESIGAAPALAGASLRDLERALIDGDPAGAAGLAPPGDDEAAGQLAAVADNARSLRLRDVSLRYLTDPTRAEGGTWPAMVEVSWRVGGVDAATVRTRVQVEFTRDEHRVTISGVGGDAGRTPVWLAGPARVDWIGESTAVIVAQRLGAPRAAEYTQLVSHGLERVRATLPGWSGGVVVEVPGGPAEMDRALGVRGGRSTDLAGVTASADGSTEPQAPVRIVLDNERMDRLTPSGERVVVTHEITHVAVGSATSAGEVPVWLDEGLADVVALREVPTQDATSADLIKQVHGAGLPAELPGPAEFTSVEGRQAAYQAAWLACRVIEDRVGSDGLVDTHRAVASGASLEHALREHAQMTRAELIRRWRSRISAMTDRPGLN